ncbi:Sb-PDE family phosphodiesterase [Niastella populi]|uniref:PHP domain-containing protein n=1 Tax=Niastella populi TaxID=550983 RepID=A0A1V9EVT3_9BACT|nr:Sb-PDE family phosphodiesterase [Niastella populi]OQP50267.1 PHP domain-containing protein [Niastella populi]
MRSLLPGLLFSITSVAVFAQAEPGHSHKLARSLQFPDVPGYKVMKCDLHQHTVFSDGSVWPDIRVAEALMDGLDAISLTEHLEYQPHKDDIPHPDRNRSYELALKEARDHKLIVIRGSEITRKMPPGHCNAVFINDANKMLISDSVEVFREAKRQNAFVFWNHPNWIKQRTDGIATLTPMHKQLIKEKLLDGIEVVNDVTYSDEALQIALDNNLTIMGTSDIHKLVDWVFDVPKGGHRPITLVFAKEATAESIREGLMNRKTVVFHNNLLIGRDEVLVPLIKESLKTGGAKYTPKTTVLEVEIENVTSCEFMLQNRSKYTFHGHADVITLKPGEKTTIMVKTVNKLTSVDIPFEVLSAINAPKSHPVVTLQVNVN